MGKDVQLNTNKMRNIIK